MDKDKGYVSFEVFDGLSEGVQVISPDLRYVYVNSVVAAQARVTKEDLLGKKMLEVFPKLNGTEIMKRISECMRNRLGSTMLNRYEHPDGSIGWFQLRLESIDAGVIVFSVDVSNEMNLEQHLSTLSEAESAKDEMINSLMKELEQERSINEYKSRVISIASHQFRTPLTSILLSSGIIKKITSDFHKNEYVEKNIQRIQSSAEQMEDMLKHLLELEHAKHHALQYEEKSESINQLLDKIIESLEPILKAGQEVKVTTNPSPCYADIDKKGMGIILLNLLSNATKYSPELSEIRVHVEKSGEDLIISIQDQGIGIPNADQAKLFNNFFRASNAESIAGTGLGLSIVKQYVNLARGSIQFDSEVDNGTTFTLRFPQQVAEVLIQKMA